VSFRRSVIIVKLWRPEVTRPGNFVSIFWKTTPYNKIFKILFRTFLATHRWTSLCSSVVKFVRREIGEIMRYLHHKKGCLPNCRFCANCPQNMSGLAPTIWLTLFRISSKWVHFWRSYSRTRQHRFFAPFASWFGRSKRGTQVHICSTDIHLWSNVALIFLHWGFLTVCVFAAT